MIHLGENIQSSSDVLKEITVEQLYEMVRNPAPDLCIKIQQLRIVRSMDAKQYTVLKKQLPYIVCGRFNPPYRKTENFAYIEYFIIDIDHLAEKELDIVTLRQKIEKDNRVYLCFSSPSGDGLKVMFRLSERCYDHGIFSLFYQAFARQYSLQYGLEQVIDIKTCDVTRACFISMDTDVFHNPFAEFVDMGEFLNTDDATSLFDLKHQLEREAKEEDTKKQRPEVPPTDKEPDEDTLTRIKEMLEVKMKHAAPSKPEREATPEIERLMEGLTSFIDDQGITVVSATNIQYGKKMQFRLESKHAEVNIFYGKRGYSVIPSPKSGTSPDFNAVMVDVIRLYILEHT